MDDAIRTLVSTVCAGDVGNPDWGIIMELCDVAAGSAADAEAVSRMVLQTLERRETEDAVSLALLVTETIMTNCPQFVDLVAGRLYLQEIVSVAESAGQFPDASARASRMLQEWVTEYPSQPVFRHAQAPLQHQTTSEFEAVDETTSPVPATSPALAAEFQKLRSDLVVVEEKIQSYRNLVAVGNHEDADDVVDFLQQCQPRMNTLIEAGLAGKLDEQTLETCLTVNDHLIKALEGDMSGESEGKAPFHVADSSPDYLSGPFSNVSMSEAPPPAPARHHYNPDMV
ncbi:hypothetical protein ACHHYP_13936 [Achlya hypogyna]|uniref:VHS domain-containing protein n=1 Tax=Achlya hypogyna TaxID=1202772 RepID=A0A1V9YE93_ACHHY|nr:hypothetical protein ACHHYP_13936 [Achlya hypogyna]